MFVGAFLKALYFTGHLLVFLAGLIDLPANPYINSKIPLSTERGMQQLHFFWSGYTD